MVLSEKIQREIETIGAKYPDGCFCLLPALYVVQKEHGWISPEALEAVADLLKVPRATARGVSTFYALFHHKPMGRHLIQLCTNVACLIMGGEGLLDVFRKRYGLHPNSTTPDGRFSLLIMECIGACDIAPAMLVDTDLHGNLSEENISEILERYR